MTRVETEERNCVHVSIVTGSEDGAGCDCIRIACVFWTGGSYVEKLDNLSKKKFFANSFAEAVILFNGL